MPDTRSASLETFLKYSDCGNVVDGLMNQFDKYKFGNVRNLGIVCDKKKMTVSVKLEEFQ